MKNDRIAPLLAPFGGAALDPHYLAYFDCFNRGLFFEAHEVLEQIWLPERGKSKDLFFKGLIQLAGAFVHVTKKRPDPAAALLRLARANLQRFCPKFEGVNVAELLASIDRCLDQVGPGRLDPGKIKAPRLELAARRQNGSTARLRKKPS